ncbi:atp-dependent helicase : ATP-dependent helicase HrpB OS=Pirellula staleyi (strain ATCC 27377 / DSM 6068 / ICPB 4128) GN=Psta_3120 PE=4 SV=1: DEAD: Helicase_C: HA2: HrpB_C [Gemmataceae bacterium]|nr:atp-dependent helicase : ATP-dependent helicase HrpB OS=Pirellula staleyi (strain ATCC 27377 / DSM 6068 / ICPB 4128) GN=Psta_3120 PE=4 SV=1: DEAD: Helicase_C: HA2: HrpB_C [Gemmataceae bacterium]VTT97492.1 atp-dependent helicase : ATP-dependent helicase HrpB OS=Pirellula staleyi (strain ATCC 27377 / DSM 6068 / ICPB 4128) GN=Psta_3120 PE=4 SV=1: DEAD: Helicase_C: HA2: HrpB_C [Gemmataceae bacterium]
MPRDPLPIDAALPNLLAALRTSGAAVLRAPTGAGKTTRVPPALVESGLAGSGLVIMLEPRRVAARAAARRMAIEHGSPLGDVYGYQVRFDRKAGNRTRVLVATPGVLLRRLHDDPFLEGVSCVVFDEFHERGLDVDLALGLVRLVREAVRPELQLVVMSATVEPGPVAAYLGGCPVVDSAGRSFPVEVKYRPRRSDTQVSLAVADAVREVLAETTGDVLAFLPGLREIRQAADDLERLAQERGFEVLPLHGDLPPEQQDRALQRLARRKVVLATNVAETSVTVDGVTAVVDSGLARQMEFEPGVGMDRLKLGPISRASADQRAGRAGRTQPGVCVRLWDEASHRGRPEQTVPEIRRVDLCGAVLQLLALGESAERFPWLDPPRPESLAESLRLLEQLGVTASGALTDVGRAAAALPVHPRLGRMLVEGQRLGCANRAALAAALLSERDPFLREIDAGPPTRTAPVTVSDVLDRVEALEGFEASGRLDGPLGRLHRGCARAVLDVRDHLARLVASGGGSTGGLTSPARQDEALLRCVFAAYPDRLARRREPGSTKAVTAGGRGVRLAPTSGVAEPELFVCVDVDAGGVDAFVRLASGVERDWLPRERVATQAEVTFDDRAEKLVARKVTRFDELVLDETPSHIPNEADAARVLAEAAAARIEKCLPPPDSAAGAFRTRVRCLRAWVPDLNLPAFDAADLREALEFFCRGRRSLADVRNGPWLDFLRAQLTYDQLRAVETEAPERIEVPSGSHIAIEYEEGRPPVLAARIQEMFGLAETPRVARGRVKVLLHLLAPNHRPQQVTDDLASFWANGYPVVRKELRGRYPKHSWPDDPLAAEAVRGARKRRE